MNTRILLLCKGNICRSPMAEVMLRERLRRDDVHIESAGLAAMRGAPIDPRAQNALLAHGLSASSHVGRQADRMVLQRADLVLAMEQRQVAAVLAQCPILRGRVALLSHWNGAEDIDDPYGRDQRVFDETYERLHACISQWQTKL